MKLLDWAMSPGRRPLFGTFLRNATKSIMTNHSEHSIDVLILGAGPAGLAAAHRCLADGLSFRVVESGPAIENRQGDLSHDLGSGVGGAGLYSDGKLSFYPSAQPLWSLPGENVLRAAYGWLQNLASDLVESFPPFPDGLADFELTNSTNGFFSKRYKSLVLGPEQRREIVERLIRPIKHQVTLDTTIETISQCHGGFVATIVGNEGDRGSLFASRVILCPGRYASQFMPDIDPQLANTFRRFEYGIRIEQAAESFFLKDDPSTDAKLMLRHPKESIEWRTFCCCRDGEVLANRTGNLSTFSGTSCTGSGKSNIGFNCRILSSGVFSGLRNEAEQALLGAIEPFSVPIDDFVANQSKITYFGKELDSYLREGLVLLGKEFDLEGSILHGPCIEGLGMYPQLNSQLESSVPGVYLAGDATGIFRGLVPAFLSGAYAAAQASLGLRRTDVTISSDAKVKVSPSAALSTIFTAQSKKFFYCRDTVCEYVFKRGHLPVNPFRVFDYFLSDRVDRDLIRRGNNHLIRTCDELWVFGPLADGVLFEVFFAARLGKPIRFFTIGTRESEIKEIDYLEDIVFEPEVHAPQQRRATLLSELQRILENRIVRRQKLLFD